MVDCLIVGGGVIGLSLAYELAKRGMAVRVLDAGQPGKEASWAGAGILPPAAGHADDPLVQMTALANRLHAQWSVELRETTCVDNGYRRCGAVYLAHDAREAAELEQLAAQMRASDFPFERLDEQALRELEPALAARGTLRAAHLAADECQIRNPRHLQALLIGCAQQGVEITAGCPAEDFELRGARVRGVRTAAGSIAADRICITTGSWTAPLARRLGVAMAIAPMRGQMVLLSLERMLVTRIVNVGKRYLVPRADGRLLIGSTEESVGFDRSTTAGAVAELLQFGIELVPELAGAPIEQSWAGLRPATRDGLPYLGRLAEWDNAFVAAGHFRSGLQLSTATAAVMSQLIRDERSSIDLSQFAPDRGAAPRTALASTG